MFYILSKALFFLIQPLNWILALLLMALFSRNAVRKKRCLVAAVLLFVFFSNHFCLNLLVRWWEPESVQSFELKEPYDIGILLGGYSNFYLMPKDGRYTFNERANRFTQTIDLYFQGKIKKILLTGGSGLLLETVPGEAEEVAKYLYRLGIPKEDLIVENHSRNTYENARFSADIIQKQFPNARCLLITSAWHMPRAAACFRKQAVSFTPFCVDYISENIRYIPASLLIPNSYNFYRWELVIKEWVGFVAYKLRGYS